MEASAIQQQILQGAWNHPSWSIYQVSGASGGECYLVVSKEGSAVLFDTGFAWSAPKTVDHINQSLQAWSSSHDEQARLDWIVLTHSHYDHAAGAGYIAHAFPHAKVACSEYARKVFTRPGALATMRKLNAQEAHLQGMTEFEDVPDQLRIDHILQPDSDLTVGSLRFTVVAAPGHTKCSLAFWEASCKLLISCETGCVCAGPVPEDFRDVSGNKPPSELKYMADPAYLVGYQQSLDFIALEQCLDPEYMLVPHYGVLSGDDATSFIASAAYFSRAAADLIVACYTKGKSIEDTTAVFKSVYYNKYVRAIQPEAAFDLNARYLVPLVLSERVEHFER